MELEEWVSGVGQLGAAEALYHLVTMGYCSQSPASLVRGNGGGAGLLYTSPNWTV